MADLRDHTRYESLNPHLAKGFEFLQRLDLAELENGRHEIDGDNVVAIIDRGMGRGQADSPLEFHRRYLDIQYVVKGIDLIGWSPIDDCRHMKSDFDTDRDLGFYGDRPSTWCRVAAGMFAIFFPTDAHAPLGGSGPIHKVVVKVAHI